MTLLRPIETVSIFLTTNRIHSIGCDVLPYGEGSPACCSLQLLHHDGALPGEDLRELRQVPWTEGRSQDLAAGTPDVHC